jgi:hypothetical protein
MNPQMQKPHADTSSAASAASVSSRRPRRRWLRWLLGFVLLCVLLVGFLPNIVALPMFRERLVDALFAKFDAKVSVGDL